jgi:hypothetical protein
MTKFKLTMYAVIYYNFLDYYYLILENIITEMIFICINIGNDKLE